MAENKIISYDVELLSTNKRREFYIPEVYTNDLYSNEFQFNILDVPVGDLAGATARILLDMRDGSFFNNSDVTRSGNTFKYVLKANEGKHYGIAKVQLVVVIGGKDYATPLYNFAVMQGLDDKKANEVVINDLNSETRKEIAKLKRETNTIITDLSAQWQQVIDETTEKDVISAPELIAARNGKSNLKTRLDDEHAQVTAQLQQTEQNLQQIEVKPYKNKKPQTMVVFIDDDARKEFLTKLKPIFDANNVTCSVAANTSKIGNSKCMSMEQLKTLQSEGYEILSHGHQHFGMDGLDEAGRMTEVLTAQEILKENGFPSYKHIVLGNGTAYNKNPDSFDFLKKHVTSGVNTSPLTGKSSAVNVAPIEQFSINRIHTPDRTFEMLKAEVDEGVAKNGLVVFFTHAWQPILDATKLAELDQIIKYIISLGIPIVSLDKALETFGNVIDTDTGGQGLKVSNTGVTNISESKLVFGVATGEFNKEITEYPLNTVTVEVVGKSSATESPTPLSGGTRTTFRHSEQNVYCYQEWRSTYSDTFYRRRSRADGSWTPSWETFSPSVTILGGSVQNVVPKLITDYELNKITIELCASSLNAGLPEGKSGTMKTYRVTDQHVYCYREFKVNNGKTYTQSAKTDGTWNTWLDPMGTPI